MYQSHFSNMTLHISFVRLIIDCIKLMDNTQSEVG
jgi:hypothetical protein